MKVTRSAIFIIIIYVFLFNIAYGQSDYLDATKASGLLKSYRIINDDFFKNENVNRVECITAILKIIGATPKTEEYYINANYTVPVFEDPDSGVYKGHGYALAAGVNGIAFGVPNHAGSSTYYSFCPLDNVTTKEAIAFILRCLQPIADTNDSLDDSFIKAKETGMIQETDAFYSDKDSFLTPSDLCVLLQRMLYQPRYKYFDEGHLIIDKSSSVTYISYLSTLQY